MRYLLRSSLSVLLAFCIVFSNSYCVIASTTTEQIYDIMPLGIYDNYAVSIGSASLNIDSNAGNALVNPVVGNLFEFDDDISNQLILSSLSPNLNSQDTLLGFYLNIYNSNPYGVNVPPLFGYDMYLDMSIMRQFLQVDNTNFDIAIGSVPEVCYALADVSYTYRYRNPDTDSLVTKNGSIDLQLPVEVFNDNFFESGGHDTHIKIHGFTFDDILEQDKSGYFSDLSLLDVEQFTCSTISVRVYAFYSLSDFYNFPSNTVYKSYEAVNGLYYYGIHNINGISNSLNFRIMPMSTDDDNTFTLSNFSVAVSNFFANFSSNMGSIVTNATDNANRIIQNTTQKVDEVKQGVVDVKNSVVETKNSILDLPNKLKEMLTGFFVPDEETINSKFAEFETLLSDRFGLIYQSAQIIHDFADSFQTQAVMLADTGGIIQLPSVTVNLAGTDFSFGGYDVDIIPDGFEFLQTAVRLATSMICTVVFINMCKNKLEAILK